MSRPVDAECVEPRQHLSAVHLQRKFVGAFANHDHMRCLDQDTAQRNNHAFLLPAVDDHGDSVAHVAPDHVVYPVRWQTGDVRQEWRLGIEQSHLIVPQHEAREQDNATVVSRQSYSCHFWEIRFRTALQPGSAS